MTQSAHQSIGQQLMCINNEWVPAADDTFLSVENPARKGTEAGQVPRGGKIEVDEAVQAAAKAFPAWRNTPARERGRAMLAIARDLEARLEEFARLYTLELGGKNPQIVFPDADTEHTVQQVVNAMRFVRQGQSCTAGSRLFLHASIFDDFLARLCETLKGLRIGDPFDESTQVGAMVNRTQFEKVCAYIREGLEQPGAQILCGGLPPESGPLAQGYFLQPTLFSGVDKHWRLAREEVFGPVLTAHPWTTEEEVIAMANASHFGLSAFIFSKDINTALKTAHALESGFVQINQGAGIVPGQSYGGFKQSGIGREWSLEGMLESFTQRKSVTVNLA